MSELLTAGAAAHVFAQRAPDEVVVICAREDGGADTLTRQQFDRWANRLAHKLLEGGVGPGDFVAVILPNCVEHLVATLAAYKAGGTPMPVSYSMPPEERDGLLALATPRCIIGDMPDLDAISRADMQALKPG